MSVVVIVFTAFALAMDAFAVSIASGITIHNLRLKHALTIALWFGLFQAVMPLLGWFLGKQVAVYVETFDHWLAFALLAFIGVKMIYEAYKIEEVEEKTNPLDLYVLFMLSVATSIDAFAVGLSLAMLKVSILLPIVVIGVITFCMSFAGVYIGDKSGHFFEKKIEVAAGLVLIGIGLKLLIQGLLA
jgi:putative Mn2+ efflux pump MntP